jgi:hypothetical protein
MKKMEGFAGLRIVVILKLLGSFNACLWVNYTFQMRAFAQGILISKVTNTESQRA